MCKRQADFNIGQAQLRHTTRRQMPTCTFSADTPPWQTYKLDTATATAKNGALFTASAS